MSSIDEKIEAFLKANPKTIYSLKTIGKIADTLILKYRKTLNI